MNIDTNDGLASSIVVFATEIMHNAGAICKKYFRSSVAVERKEDGSPVTVADREVERYLRDAITAQFPTHRIVGEEHENEGSERAEYIWYIDPIDGTYSFINGIPIYTSLLALYYNDGCTNEALFGIVYNPQLDELAIGIKDKGCYVNGAPQQVRACQELSEARLHTTNFAALAEYIGAERVGALCGAVKSARTWCDAYGYILLVTGRADAIIDYGLKVWDIAPLYIIATEAGAAISNFEGEEEALGTSCIAAYPPLQQKLLHYVR